MSQNTDQALAWLGLSSIPGVGRITFRKLASRFGSPGRVLAASCDELHAVSGLPDKVIRELVSSSWRAFAEQECDKADKAGIRIVTFDDPAYPDRLRSIPDPPLYLYVNGSLAPEDGSAVAIVGTRKPTHYGKTVTNKIASGLASSGFTVVSGLARGIDTEAHKGALAVHGRTIAVLGCGIDVAYPPENRELMDEIVRQGAVMTENPFGTMPEPGYFPGRNRIISGLAQGTVIVEAAADSGSLITARYALEQGRRLFAVPGYVGSPVSKGTNSLIRQGAMLVESAEDVLQDLGASGKLSRQSTETRPLPPLSRDEEAVFHCITLEPKHIDHIMNECGAAAGTLSGVLITLELKGLAKQLPGKFFIRERC